MRRVDPDNPSSIRSLARLAGNLNNKPAARNDHTAQPGAEPMLNRFALKPLALRWLITTRVEVTLCRWAQWWTSTEPVSTRFPDDSWLRPTCCSVTVSVGKSTGETPTHNVTLGPWLKVPAGTRIPAVFFSQAS